MEECLTLLQRKQVGRIAMTTPAGLRILPVNYSVVEEQVVFRTLPYGEIANNVVDAEVAFEVDELDESMRSGWSVMAAGPCRRIEDPDRCTSSAPPTIPSRGRTASGTSTSGSTGRR